MGLHRLVSLFNVVQVGFFFAALVAGSLFTAVYLTDASRVERWKLVVFAITAIPSFIALLLLAIGLIIIRAKNHRRRLPQDNGMQKQRLYGLGKDVSGKMGYPEVVEFAVGVDSAAVYTRKSNKRRRIVVGNRFLRGASDDEVRGIVGHELVHAHQKSRRRILNIIANEFLALQLIFSFLPIVSIVFGTLFALVKLTTLPVSWRLEYEADRQARKMLGSELMVSALNKLAETSHTGISMTHPSLSKRLARIKKPESSEPRVTSGEDD